AGKPSGDVALKTPPVPHAPGLSGAHAIAGVVPGAGPKAAVNDCASSAALTAQRFESHVAAAATITKNAAPPSPPSAARIFRFFPTLSPAPYCSGPTPKKLSSVHCATRRCYGGGVLPSSGPSRRNSVRRLRERPASLPLSAMGRSEP